MREGTSKDKPLFFSLMDNNINYPIKWTSS